MCTKLLNTVFNTFLTKVLLLMQLLLKKLSWMANSVDPDQSVSFTLFDAFLAKILLLCSCFLTHCVLNRLSHAIYWKSPISILGTSGYEIYIFLEKNG